MAVRNPPGTDVRMLRPGMSVGFVVRRVRAAKGVNGDKRPRKHRTIPDSHPEIGDPSMKRILLCGLGVSVVLALGLAGCGSAGVDTGVPPDTAAKEEHSTSDPLKGFATKMGPAAARAAAAGAAKAAREKAASPIEQQAEPK